jgi:methyl-accepting chemotaxis protein
MLNSLRTRLLATMLFIVLLALGIMAAYIHRTTIAEYERSVGGILRYRDPRISLKIVRIQDFITQNTGEREIWDGLQQLLVAMQADSSVRFIMADLGGNVYADSAGELIGQHVNLEGSKPFAAYLVEGEPILAYFEPADIPNPQSIQQNFIHSINRSLFIAVLSSSILALILALLLSRSILSPVSALTRAARRMERGDLSQRVQSQGVGELGELAQAFNAMADGLQRQEQLRRNMVTDVAHELRTPLSNVRGYLEALQDGVLAPTPEVIHSLHDEALLLSRLVDDLQELSLAEAGQFRIDLCSV